MENIKFINDNNVLVKIPTNLTEVHQKLFHTRPNAEVKFRKLVEFLLRENVIDSTKNIIDCGAWIGDNAVPWSKNITGLVYAIDPSKENCNFILKLKEINEIKNLKILNFALSNTNEMLYSNGHINHCVYQSKTRTNVQKPPASIKEGSEDGFKHCTKSYFLDFLLKEKIIDNITFIHLDAEGFEYGILKGANNLIQQFNPVIKYEVQLNLKDRNGNLEYLNIVNYLKKMNYTNFIINEIDPWMNPQTRNIIAFYNYNATLEKKLQKFSFINDLQIIK